MSAKKYLISLGVQLDRLSTISYGEEMPVDPRHDETAWTKNRRAHFVILSR
jgi:peptidoglycan-associated lipoprotein